MSVSEVLEHTITLRVKQKAHALIYWENFTETAVVVFLGFFWFFLISWMGYASSTILCDLALIHLVARVVYRYSCRVLGDLNMIEKRPVPVAPEVFVTEEEMLKHLKTITATVNWALHAAYAIALCDCNLFVFKCMLALFVTMLASKALGTTGLFFFAFAGVFSMPKVYELKKTQIDMALELFSVKAVAIQGQVTKHAGSMLSEAKNKLSALTPPKASDLQASAKATNVKPKAL